MHHPQPQPHPHSQPPQTHHRPSPIPQTQPQHQHPHQHAPAQQGQGYGSAIFNTEPRREGRTVPTTSGLFDTARRPAGAAAGQDNPGGASHHQQSQHAVDYKPDSSSWGTNPNAKQHPHRTQTLPQLSNDNGNSNGVGIGIGGGKGPSPVNGVPIGAPQSYANVASNAPSAHDGNGPTNGNGSANANASQTGENGRVPVRFPGLGPYRNPNQPTPATPQQQPSRVGVLSPPKSSLGVTGVPTSTRPFI